MLGESVDGLVPEEHGALDAAVEYIAENKMSMRNLAEYSHAVGILKEAINAKKDKKNMFHLKDKQQIGQLSAQTVIKMFLLVALQIKDVTIGEKK